MSNLCSDTPAYHPPSHINDILSSLSLTNGTLSTITLPTPLPSPHPVTHSVTVINWGTSTQLTPIRSVRICPPSANPLPTVLLMAGIHGNEPLGTTLLTSLICSLNQRDSIFLESGRALCFELAPVVNPDGLAANTRENGAGVDLNRQAPVIPYHAFIPSSLHLADIWADCQGAAPPWQPEVCALTARLHAEPPVLSAVFHGGALVANYPWDGRPDKSLISGLEDIPCPDDGVARWVSRQYAAAHPRMGASTEFDQGITNGAAWYPVYGSWQDYVYGYTGRMSITIELDDNKKPSPQLLPSLIAENIEPIVAFFDAGDTGVRGFVRAANTGLLIPNVRVSFSSSAGVLPVVTDHHGFFVQIVVPGTTTDLIFEAPGYERLVIGSVTTVAGPMVVNVSLAVDLDATTARPTAPSASTTAAGPAVGTTAAPGGVVDVKQDSVARHANATDILGDARLAGAAASLAIGIICCVCVLCVAAGSMAGVGVPTVAANIVAGRPALARSGASGPSTRPGV